MLRIRSGLLVGMALLLVTGVAAQQDIYTDNPWDREMARGLVADQEQTKESVLSGSVIGQVFTPAADWLERVDVLIKNRTDHTPGKIRLLAWAGNYADTVAQEPLWEDDADFSGADMPVLRHYYPRIAVEPGAPYLLEIARPSESFYVGGVSEDVYPGGFVIANGTLRAGWDMWFRTFTKGESAPIARRPLPELSPLQPTAPRGEFAVTRETYLDTIRAHAERSQGRWNGDGRTVAEALYYAAFLHKYAQEDRYMGQLGAWLAKGTEYMQGEGAGVNPWFGNQLALALTWLRGSPQWTAEYEAAGKEMLLTVARRMWPNREYGAMNRSLWTASMLQATLALYPEVPEAAEWRAYAEKIWHQFADFADTEEDSGHYNAVFNYFLLVYLHATGQEDFLKQPGAVRWVARYRDILAPNGMMVGWGDSMGIGGDWGAWAALFETTAKVTGDGRFKEAARRTVQAHARYILDPNPLLCVYEDMTSLPLAYIGADDGIAPVALEEKSGVYTCAYARLRPRGERQEGWFELEDRQTPWKLVMRSAEGELSDYALFGLLPNGGHGHADAPAILSLAANGTIFLDDTTYMDRRWEDHNQLFGVRVSGGKLGPEPSETVVRSFAEAPAAGYADIAWSDYSGWGMDFVRQVLHVKGLGWLVHDRTQAQAPAEWHLGPTWQVERMRTRGENWFDIDNPAPYSFAWPLANGTDHLLIWFAPKADSSVDYSHMPVRIREGKPWYTSAPYCVYQTAGPLQVSAEQPAWFTTLLRPLAQERSPREAAEEARVVADGPGATVLEVREGAVKWTLAVINDGKAHQVGPVTAQAQAVVVREGAGALAVQAFGVKSVKAAGRALVEVEGEAQQSWGVGW